MHHLQIIQKANGNPQHPINDPLWSSWQVQFFLRRRPPLYDDKKRKVANQGSQHKYYKNHKVKQATLADEMKQKLDGGEIDEKEYAQYLIGDRRRQFLTELRLKSRIEADVRNENEQKLQDEIHRRLQQLRDVQEPDTNGIAALGAAQMKLNNTKSQLDAYKTFLSNNASEVVNFWARDGFLETNQTFIQYHGFIWPAQSSAAAFYKFGTLLVPIGRWDTQIQSDSAIRHMHKELEDYINTAKQNAASLDDVGVLNQVIATFNGYCDIVRSEQERSVLMTTDGAQNWLDAQEKLWNDAKQEFRECFNIDSRPPIQLFRLIDEYTDTWRAQKDAEEENDVARAVASGLVS
jgi:hypothetical protein